MRDDFFQFRDFSMKQAPSGQRVNTDSCVFGALIGQHADPSKIMDIGTGTGVLALMLAVRFPNAKITAVEPEHSIAEVARQNFSTSPWQDRIDLAVCRAQDLTPDEHGTYDFVLCNPPYFQNSMISDNRLRMVARHNMDLQPRELYDSMIRVLSENGSAWISFPEDSTPLWMDSGAGAGLHPTHRIVVKDHPDARPHMTVVGWSKSKPSSIVDDTIHYRSTHKGALSPWMMKFREDWYPERFNAQFY